jgi:hypothetical protein
MSRKANLRVWLFAGVSTVALTVATPEVRAADMAVPKAILKAPPVAPALPVLTIWLEGGGFWTGGGDHNAIFHNDDYYDPEAHEVNRMKPQVGWEIAFGADYRIAASPWHVSFDLRYGQAHAKDKKFFGSNSSDGFQGNNFEEHESHMVADFMIGRDFNLGIGQSQIKVGVRVADLRATQLASGFVTASTFGDPSNSAFSDKWRSRFLGIGPRAAIDGSVPLGGPWAFDYMAGVAVLFGDRKLERTFAATGNSGCDSCNFATGFTKSYNDSGSVFNVDASGALSYWFTPRAKLSAGVRVDSYWNAIRTLSPNWNDQSVANQVINVDRVFWGPFGRLTGTF